MMHLRDDSATNHPRTHKHAARESAMDTASHEQLRYRSHHLPRLVGLFRAAVSQSESEGHAEAYNYIGRLSTAGNDQRGPSSGCGPDCAFDREADVSVRVCMRKGGLASGCTSGVFPRA